MLMPSIDLNILHWMTESQFVDAGATGSVAVNLHHWEGIDQLLRNCFMSFHCVVPIRVEGLVVEGVLGEGKVPDRRQPHTQEGRGGKLGSQQYARS